MTCLNPALDPMHRGDNYSFDVTIIDADGDAVDIAGDTITLTVKEAKSDTVAILSKDITSFTDAANGVATIEITEDESYHFPIATLYVGLTWDNGNIVTILDTTIQVSEPTLTPTEPTP